MSDKAEIAKLIEDLCKNHSLYLEHSENGNFKIFSDHASGISLFLKVEEPTDFSFYFSERTFDVVYNGDRSDVHVVISLMFASFLRSIDSGISCSLFDIPHPVVEDEIWGRYIMPEQIPDFLGISSWEQVKEAVSKIIAMFVFWRAVFWSFASCPCEECSKRNNTDNEREYELPEEIFNSVNKTFKSSSHVNYGSRIRPCWNYYYDMDNEVTIIKSKELSLYLELIQKSTKRKLEKVEGLNGTLIVDGEINNFIGKKPLKDLNKLIKELLKTTKPVKYSFFPMENMIVAFAYPFIVGLGRLAGIHPFKSEKELLRNRHNKESEILFPVPLFEWQNEVCPDQFEKLIKSLLEREPSVKTVRRPAPINQGDKGRDLIIEWNVRNSNVISEKQPPTSLIKVVGQCKASKNTVGKNKVLDIRDTIETHNSHGYFLAVSTQISEALTEKLEELRLKGFWVDWWNRDDIEIRLSKNQNLLPQFPKVLRAKNKIKFIDK